MNGLVKICGLTERAGLDAALSCGADMIGIICRAGTPRSVGLDAAALLVKLAEGRARTVAVVADANDSLLAAVIGKINPDVLQLHGGETPKRTAEIGARFKKPVFKALGIADKNDLVACKAYQPLCEKILLEAKTPQGSVAGGSGRAFDWKLLQHLGKRDNIILAGGLTPENVAEAIMMTGVGAVDVSSGVESAPGLKDKFKIARFIQAARDAFAASPAASVFA
jgi:phosphoribosylanthranilate isomerase